MFPQHKKTITDYLNKHSLDLNKEEDLKTLLHFSATL